MSEYGDYVPNIGDRITVHRTSSLRRGEWQKTGTVLGTVTILGVEHIDFWTDDKHRVYLSTNDQMLEMSITQTIRKEYENV